MYRYTEWKKYYFQISINQIPLHITQHHIHTLRKMSHKYERKKKRRKEHLFNITCGNGKGFIM